MEAPPVHAALVGALLNGLAGDSAAAKAYLDRLLAMRVMASAASDELGNSTSREWTFYLSTGLYLQNWKFGELAAYLWEKTLADPALIRLEGDYAREISREMSTKLNALRLSKFSPREAAIKMEDLFATSANEEVIAVGEALETMGALPHAIALYRRLWEREPSDPQPLRNLLNACRMADDLQTTETVLRACISDRSFPNDTVRRDFAGQLADLLERKSDITGALKVISEAVTGSPADLRLLQRLAQLNEKAGNFPEAAAAWRQLLTLDPTHALGTDFPSQFAGKAGGSAGRDFHTDPSRAGGSRSPAPAVPAQEPAGGSSLRGTGACPSGQARVSHTNAHAALPRSGAARPRASGRADSDGSRERSCHPLPVAHAAGGDIRAYYRFLDHSS